MENIIPTEGRLLVEPIVIEETQSGLYQVEIGHSTPVRGKVVKACNNSPYAVGDTLYFRRYSVDELNFKTEDGGEKKLWVVEFGDIVAYEKAVL